MTNEEAHAILEGQQSIYTSHRYAYSEELIEANGKAIEALEKQIAKETIKIIDRNKIPGNWKKVCPTCGAILVERITEDDCSYPRRYNDLPYCRCGQHIYWRE